MGVAVAALAAYAAWSYLSIAWSDQGSDAWDGANRTALYAALFALFALWRIRGPLAAGLVGAFVLGVAVIGLKELLEVAATDRPEDHFMDGRLSRPVGYVNGNVALWSAAFWPCVVLAARREVPAALRALFGGSAVLLGGLALMGQSRGWLFALPVVTIVFLAVTPRRVRTSLTLLAVLAAVATTIPAVLEIYDEDGPPLAEAADGAVGAVLLAAALAPIVFGAAALLDRRVRAPRRVERGAGLALAALAAGALFVGAVVYVSERGNPATDVADAWDEFKTNPTPAGGATRLGALGSNRYDFWRVAWNQFESAPLKGVGADTFQQAYLADARSGEQPRYPHSVELRTLSQTGLIGAALLSVGLAAALLSAWRALRLRRGPAQAAAAAGVAAFTYWIVHGSVDWFWEIPALGGAAFALLGLAAGLAPRRPALRPARRVRPLLASAVPVTVGSVAGIALAFSVVFPWFSERYVDQALDHWRRDPGFAFDRLDRARWLNRLSATPDIAAGSIALQLGRNEEAEARFRAAVERNAGDSHSHLRLGAILFNDGRREEGLRHLREARRLDRRDEIIRRTLARARRGRDIDIRAMNQAIADRYREIGDR
ncbi:MAG TPA: O-antigen ligase family protein [Thermoleophilaceae bacterium]|nr:O-antigen ligase family protein [Thermoleophilaceae bacterium]